jgi:hypothetical protein
LTVRERHRIWAKWRGILRESYRRLKTASFSLQSWQAFTKALESKLAPLASSPSEGFHGQWRKSGFSEVATDWSLKKSENKALYDFLLPLIDLAASSRYSANA